MFRGVQALGRERVIGKVMSLAAVPEDEDEA